MTQAPPVPPDADRRTGQAYLLFAVSLLLVVLLGSVLQLWSFRPGLALTEILLILLPAVVFVRRKHLPVPRALGWTPVAPGIALLSLVVGVTGWGVAAAMGLLVESLLGPAPRVEALAPRTPQDLAIVLVVAALLPGFCEETLFRGAIQRVLGRRGPWRGVVITAALFAVFHVNPWLLLPAFFLGVVFGGLALRTGSTLPAILAHAATNATAFSVSFAFHDRQDADAYLLIGALSALCVLAMPLAWARTREAPEARAAPPLLATVPAALGRATVWVGRLVLAAVLVALTALVAAGFLLVEVRTAADEALGPGVRPGDRLILFRGGAGMDLETGDVVEVRADGGTALARITRLDHDTVWVAGPGEERRLLREALVAKLVHTLRPAADSGAEPATP